MQKPTNNEWVKNGDKYRVIDNKKKPKSSYILRSTIKANTIKTPNNAIAKMERMF